MHERQFYINSTWVNPVSLNLLDVIDPSTEEPITQIALGGVEDTNRAVAAAKAAFPAFARTSREERLALLRRILSIYNQRYDEMAAIMSREMGAPLEFAKSSQAYAGRAHFERTIEALEVFPLEEMRGTTAIWREPVGVCGLITPWNWPMNQIVCKVAPALAAGCTMVLKPSEIAPLNAILFAEIMHEAGVPAGVFNLVNGDGATVGAALSAHPDIAMMSFTGSTRAGIAVAQAAAVTVKRVSQELGGKSPNIILADADFERAVSEGVASCFSNTGQSCNAPTRMFVPVSRHAEAKSITKRVAESFITGDPSDPRTTLGPVVSNVHYERIQKLIQAGYSSLG